MIYLCCPYSHAEPAVREQRFRAASEAAATLFRAGHHVFSPVSHSHPVATSGVPLPGDFAFWSAWCLSMLARCDAVAVLPLPGWQESTGVAAELQFAREADMPVAVLEPGWEQQDLSGLFGQASLAKQHQT